MIAESPRSQLCLLTRLVPVLAVALLCLYASPASADFRLCNNTSSRVGIALGYKDAEGWTTEGWWNISSRSCETLLRGTLVARYYYIYAIDYDRGGEWSGQAFMCSRDKEFTIRGIEQCLARGYDRLGFFEVDTQDQRQWTVQLTDEGQRPQAQPPMASPGQPPTPQRRPDAVPAATPARPTPLPNAPAGPSGSGTVQGGVPAFTAPR